MAAIEDVGDIVNLVGMISGVAAGRAEAVPIVVGERQLRAGVRALAAADQLRSSAPA